MNSRLPIESGGFIFRLCRFAQACEPWEALALSVSAPDYPTF